MIETMESTSFIGSSIASYYTFIFTYKLCYSELLKHYS